MNSTPPNSYSSSNTSSHTQCSLGIRAVSSVARVSMLLAVMFGLSTKSAVAAEIGTAFQYQGVLEDESGPANGTYDFQFSLFDADAEGTQVGSTQTDSAVEVTDGAFAVALDFGSDFREARWLEIGVRPSGSLDDYTTLTPRQPLMPVPNALVASQLAGAVTASQLEGVYTNRVNLNNAGNAFTGTFFGSGTALNGLNANEVSVGVLSDDRLSDNVALLDAQQTFTATNRFNGKIIVNDETGPQLSLKIGTNASFGASISMDATSNTNGHEYIFRAIGDAGEDDAGKLILQDKSKITPLMTFATNGFVGINNNDPTNALHVGGQISASKFVGNGSELIGLNADHITQGTLNSTLLNTNVARLNVPTQTFLGDNTFGGSVTLSTLTSENVRMTNALLNPNRGQIDVKDEDSTTSLRLSATSNGGALEIRNETGDNRLELATDDDNAGKIATYGDNGNLNVWAASASDDPDRGFLGVYDSNGSWRTAMYIASDGWGWVETDAIKINGGADIAEPFNVQPHDSADDQEIEPGMLVAIDPDRAGELRVSSQPYDRTVAGIISGAGGVNPGLTLQQKGTLADGEHPVALTGRVWCYVDADVASVQPGDLLTTSEVPGHAMKVTDYGRAQGAIVGKAMTKLEHGQGLVLVLVTLQ